MWYLIKRHFVRIMSSYSTLKCEGWEKELRNAIGKNDLDLVKTILSRPEVMMELPDRHKWKCRQAPWHRAAGEGKDKMVRMMFEAGVDVNSYLEEYDTALHHAARENRLSTVKLLLEFGVDASLVGTNGPLLRGTPLDHARKCGNKKIVALLERHQEKLKLEAEAEKDKFHAEKYLNDMREKLRHHDQRVAELEESIQISKEIEKCVLKMSKADVELRSDLEAIALEERKVDMEMAEARRLADIRKSELFVKRMEVNEKAEVSKKQVENSIAFWRKQNGFKTKDEMDKLEKECKEVEKWSCSLKDVNDPAIVDKSKCPICFLAPEKEVWECTECHNWQCGTCHGDNKFTECPFCRINFDLHPAKRNVAMERLLCLA